jgi:fibrillarin-like rRNA methylase
MGGSSDKKIKVKNIMNSFLTNEKESRNNIYNNLEDAKKQWEYAKNIFENVSQPDLVDYAIYNVVAAEKKYTYLLKKLRKEIAE